LVCLLGQVAGVAHLGLVSHVRCLEHDALVHTSASGAGDHHEVAPTSSRTAVSGVPADIEDHSDDHCLAAGLRNREQGLAPVTTAVAVAAFTVADASAGRLQALVPAPPVALLHLAPKSSPPSPPAIRG
jgi:hypothetical protein